MPEEIDRQFILDQEHLKLLSWGFVISGVFAALISVFGLFYMLIGAVMGIAISHTPPPSEIGETLSALMVLIFTYIGLIIFILAISMAVTRFWAAHCIQQRKSRTYCMVIAALGCMEFPLGTALGVLSFMVLGRESVVKQFS